MKTTNGSKENQRTKSSLLILSRFGVAEHALSAIYALAKHPDNVCTDIIRRKTKAVFECAGTEPSQHLDNDHEMVDAHNEPCKDEQRIVTADASFFPLSQLLFIVGHVAGESNTVPTIDSVCLCRISEANCPHGIM